MLPKRLGCGYLGVDRGYIEFLGGVANKTVVKWSKDGVCEDGLEEREGNKKSGDYDHEASMRGRRGGIHDCEAAGHSQAEPEKGVVDTMARVPTAHLSSAPQQLPAPCSQPSPSPPISPVLR